MSKKKILVHFFIHVIIFSSIIFPASAQLRKVPKFDEIDWDATPTFSPWELIIYRPYNSETMNGIRCWLKLEDENGNDVTYSNAKACYFYTSSWVHDKKTHADKFYSFFKQCYPRYIYNYQKTYWFEGGLAMHLFLKPGKYKISVYTPSDKQWPSKVENKEKWVSNVFEYNTENPAKALWIVPTANENGFYDGGWWIDYKVPEWFKFTKPKRN